MVFGGEWRGEPVNTIRSINLYKIAIEQLAPPSFRHGGAVCCCQSTGTLAESERIVN